MVGLPDRRKNQPGAADLPPALRVATPFFELCSRRRKQYVLEEKPEPLRRLGTVDQKSWRRYQNFLKRVSPLERAEFYARELRERRLAGPAAVAAVVGDPAWMVRRYLRLLGLPEPIRAYLSAHRTPENLRRFCLRELEELLSIRDPKAACRRFQEAIEEARMEAGGPRA